MSRLPTVGGDAGNWGDILNDYLSQSHTADGKLRLDIANISDLKALDVTQIPDKMQVMVGGYYAHADGGGGQFYYDQAASDTDNGGTTIAPTADSGRWKRIYSGAVNVKWFGAKVDGTTDDSSALAAAFTVSDVCVVPKGTTKLAASVLIGSNKCLLGEGRASTILVSGAGALVIKGDGAGVSDLKIYADTGYTGTAVTIKGYSGATTRNRPFIRNCYLKGITATGTAISVLADTTGEPVSLFTLRDLVFQGWQYGIKIYSAVASGSTWANGGIGGGFTFTGQTQTCIDISVGGLGGTEGCSGNTFSGVQIQTDSTLVHSVYMHGGAAVSTNSVTGIHQWDISTAASQPVIDVQSGYANYVEGVFGDDGTHYVVSPTNIAFVRRNNGGLPSTLQLGAKKITQGLDSPGIITSLTPLDASPNVNSVAILRCTNTSAAAINRLYAGEGYNIGRKVLLIGDGFTSLTPSGSGSGKLHPSIGTLLLAANTFYELIWDGSYWYRIS